MSTTNATPGNAAIVPLISQSRLPSLNLALVDQNLTLANGMTAGYGDNDGNNFNPLPNGGQYGKWPYQPTRVGFLRNVSPLQASSSLNPSGLYTMYFMYNPNQIAVSWQTNVGSVAPLYLYGQDGSNAINAINGAAGTDNAQVPNLANTQSVSWSLFFDRTYDMMYGNSPGANPQDDRGVLKDVAALYNLMGTFATQAAVPVSGPVEVVFGQNGAGQLWGFTGYLTSLNITYGIFRHDMIPSRCEVDLTMTCTYVSNAIPSSSAAVQTSGAASQIVPGGGVGPNASVNGPPALNQGTAGSTVTPI